VTASRWWIYQRERFPLVGHGILVLAFSAAAVGYSASLRSATSGAFEAPRPASFVVAFVVCLLFFLQLRIADEWKDAEEDARFRPERPVPRGLVTLRELAVVGVIAGVVQLVAALLLEPRLLAILAIAWLYFALMSREFFVADLLRPRHALYLVSHMFVLPIVDCFATACDWMVHRSDAAEPSAFALGLAWFLAASYCNGVVVEIGRKLRAPSDEREGVNTYTSVWGRPRAIAAWCGALLASAMLGLGALGSIGAIQLGAPILCGGAVAATAIAVRFARSPTTRGARTMEHVAGLWTVLFAVAVGLAPLLVRAFGAPGSSAS
jgi:4-hydroxybenzoate polyprenyltransferase